MKLDTTLTLASVEADADLREACRSIVLGHATAYEAATLGAGHSFELIAAEIRRLERQAHSKKSTRIRAALEGVRDGGLEIAANIGKVGGLDEITADLVANWALLAGLLESAVLHDVAERLFAVCTRHGDASRRAILAAAEAVTSTFPTPAAGIAFWTRHAKGQTRHYAVDYLLRQDPWNPAARSGLVALYTGVLEDYISADAELMLADAAEAVGARAGPDGARGYVTEILTSVPDKYREELKSRLSRRTFSREWIRWFEEAPTRPASDVNLRPSGALEIILKAAGVDPTVFRPDANHPPEICQAIAHYLQNEDQCRTVSRATEVAVRQIDYPASFSNTFKRRLTRFTDEIKRVRQGNLSADAFGGSLDPDHAPMNELTSRSPLRAKLLLIVSFFFFTEQRRKDSWGVIPLGRQRAFGMVIPTRLLQAAFNQGDLVKLGEDYSIEADPTDRVGLALDAAAKARSNITITGAWWQDEHLISFLKTLIDHLDHEKGRILVRSGFVMGDLLVQMLRHRPEGASLIPKLDRLLLAEGDADPKRPGDESALSVFPIITNSGNTYSLPERVERTCALFDLGQIDVIRDVLKHRQAREDYSVLIIRHRLEVPAGIGFSLPLLPNLLQRRAWLKGEHDRFLYEEIRQKAIECIVGEPGDWIEEFLKIGIDLIELEPELKVISGSGAVSQALPKNVTELTPRKRAQGE